MCKKFGANNVIDLNDVKRIDPLVDICIFSSKGDQTLLKVLDYIKPNGIIFPQVRITDEFLLNKINNRKLNYGRAFAYHINDFYRVIDLINDGAIQTDSLVTSEIDLFDVNEIVASILNKQNHIKIMLSSQL